MGAEGRTVVGDHPLKGDAQPGKVLGSSPKEADGAILAFIWIDLGEGNPAVVIDSHEQEFPAYAAGGLGSGRR